MNRARWRVVAPLVAALGATVAVAYGVSGTRPAASAAAPQADVAQARIALASRIPLLDPDLTVESSSLDVLHLIGGTLLELSDDGLKTRFGLARSYSTSKDGLTTTFVLKPNLKFSNGQPLTGKDVVATLTRSLKDKKNVNAGLFLPIKSVTSSGDKVVFHLKNPYPSLPYEVTQPLFPILPAGSVAKGGDFYKQPVSAGPYMIKSVHGDDKVVLVRNPNYVGPKPVIQTITFQEVVDPNTRLIQLKSGQVDVADSLLPSVVPQLTGATHAQIKPAFGGIYMYVNDRKPPLDDSRVRRAMSLAIDRTQLNNVTFLGKSNPLNSFFPTTFACCYQGVLNKTADTAAAKKLLVGTACEKGCKISLVVRSGLEFQEKMAVIIQQDLKPIGIDIQVQVEDQAVVSQAFTDGSWQLHVNSLFDVVPVPDGMVTWGLLPEGGLKALFSGYDSKDMDRWGRQVIATSGAAKKTAITNVNKIFARDMPYVPLTDLPLIAGTRLPDSVIHLGTTSFYEVGRSG